MACMWVECTLLWEGGPAESSGSHSFLSHFRQAGNRCRLGLGWAGTSQTTPNPRTVTCTSVNWETWALESRLLAV